MADTKCYRCGADYTKGSRLSGIIPGYATLQLDGEEHKICYDCASNHDWGLMQRDGDGILYLTGAEESVWDGERWVRRTFGVGDLEITDWPGRLRFKVHQFKVGRHNIAGRRIDVWFFDQQGRLWHGVNYGYHSQRLHCKRSKVKGQVG